tara:strand:+ start:45 stop:398 length:354 start_codon:yes stop_codon:yes gene_type:complete
MELEVAEIAESLNVEKRAIFIVLSQLNYIANNNQRWELTEEGTEIFNFAKLPVLVFEIKRKLESTEEENFISKKMELEKENKRIECDWCKVLKHPAEFGPNGEVCTPCLRRYFARKR